MHTPKYHLLPADLRTAPDMTLRGLLASATINDTSTGPILSPSLPTLLLFECVLVYMEPAVSEGILQWFIDYFSPEKTPLGGIVYEMFGLGDAFGKVMVSNLKVRLASDLLGRL